MVAVAALAVVPAGQVDTSGFAVTLDEAICTLIDICRDEHSHVNRGPAHRRRSAAAAWDASAQVGIEPSP